ncbi:septum formation inhibitor Maf [[Haemophilus] ducreyi]|nr:nucleoside triphosphate pyrophosphatase [[Haemophilus] ducreyi]AKO45885.1 septum formation inhibitor Maf [[Haemophilus] ducreyi]AKO47244.1 septum formation inhibitor Maf [[Haemophilus] ducreyi]AKO48608.1 septum formation inhibitor Maf [[Haemophilus] ducreyi]AKO49978.1 septum formation inhibitor Maf [[Haemophilus] ducreyi]ANF62311.1 septum formation inhibitor Maf [[Haemophilus] ducreyi]
MMHKKLYLASNSPRRWALLQNLGLALLPLASEIDETAHANEMAQGYCSRIAREKNQVAQAVRIRQNLAEYPILTADTTVSIDGEILGKPSHQQQAVEMLKKLSGRTHQVYTAVCVSANQQLFECIHSSEVTFKRLSEAEIYAYIATGEPMDKAGAYGIQALGGIFIQHLAGSFTGVMGLPIFETVTLLKKVNIEVFPS